MPRLYILPRQFEDYPVALTFAFQVEQLKARPGAMDQLIARASRRVDGYAKKRIGAPPTTTVATSGIAAGATTLPLTSVLGFDNGQEQAIVIGSGSAQETIPVLPGGVVVDMWSESYPGSLKLAQPVAHSHIAGEVVQGCYQEISTAGRSSGGGVYDTSLAQFDQGAQIALMHAPHVGVGELTRTVFLKCYPITAVLKIEHMLPFTSGEWADIEASRIGIAASSGYLRLALGSFVLPGGLVRTTYQAGYASPPDDIMEAAAWYAADELQTIISKGAHEIQSGKGRAKYADGKATKSLYELRAEETIRNGGYRRSA